MRQEMARSQLMETVQSGLLYRRLVEHISDVVWISDFHHNLVYVSPSIESSSGYTPQEILGLSVDSILAPESAALARRALAEELPREELGTAPARSRTLELEVIRKDGTRHWTEVRVSFLRNSEGEPIGTLAVSRDITERRLAQEESRLMQAQVERLAEAAEAGSRAKNAFLANVSHELRTPINGILGMADLLADTETNPEQDEYADAIRNCGRALLGMVDEILEYSRVEAGAVKLEFACFDLERLLHEAAVRFKLEARSKGLTLALHYPAGTWRRFVGPAGALRQVISKLLANAVKFTSKGGIRVEVSAEDAKPDQAIVQISVSDTGIGIAPENISLLFRHFGQLDASLSRKYEGLGLGLAISRLLVKILDGTIEVSSTPGKGSTFVVTVPLRRAPETN